MCTIAPIFYFRLTLNGRKLKMGQKLCLGGSDTPLVTFRCILINRGPNVKIDIPDGGVDQTAAEDEESVQQFCCVQWRHRRAKRKRNDDDGLLNNENIHEIVRMFRANNEIGHSNFHVSNKLYT